MKKIAIDIDLIRDWHTSLISTYVKQIDDWDGDISEVEPQDLWKHFKFPQYIEVLKDKDEDGNQYDGFVEKSLVEDLDGEYEINQDFFNQFIGDNVLEIFGHAKEKEDNVIFHLNDLQKQNYDITLYSTSKGKGKPATLFFLSKYGCEINKIVFTEKDSDFLSQFDEVLTKVNFKGSLKQLDFKN